MSVPIIIAHAICQLTVSISCPIDRLIQLRMVLAASHGNEKAHPGIFILNPGPGATPGLRVR